MLLVSEPILGQDEKEALKAVIDSNWITMGSLVQAFERAFADEHQVAEAVAVNSCTAGLHLAIDAFGIGPGDEVLVPSMTFVATANAVLYCGATPVFVDIESLNLPLMSIADAAAKCTPHTKAVIVMHFAGQLVDAEAWRVFANTRGLVLIEDSAHAVGRHRGPVFGDAAVFSFYGNKNMTTAEGGMVIAGRQDILDRVRLARGHGLSSSTRERLLARVVSYDVTVLGYNYRMNELNAAIGLVQLGKLYEWNEKRRVLTSAYETYLHQYCPEVTMAFSTNRISCHHILPIVLPVDADREWVIDEMREGKIQTTIHYPAVHTLSLYRERFPSVDLPVTEEFAARELTLPLHPKMVETQVEHVTLMLAKSLARLPRRRLQ
jgi:dTDP-4-amino-4,6-dideoxygalactose transaminase